MNNDEWMSVDESRWMEVNGQISVEESQWTDVDGRKSMNGRLWIEVDGWKSVDRWKSLMVGIAEHP
jgi:hypothetical protein